MFSLDIITIIKNKFHFAGTIDPEALYRRISAYRYVSFDIFDTLIKRNVEHSVDVFSILELQAGSGFREQRIAAENKAREEAGSKEITLKDIYAHFPADRRKVLAEQEIKTELGATVANRPVLSVFRRCIDEGKTVYLISDMYLPEDVVVRILKKAGISGYRKLFLSSTYGVTKRSGGLYKALLSEEGLKSGTLMHVGDSNRGDYLVPRTLGIQAVLIPRRVQNLKFRGMEDNGSIQRNYLNHFIINTFDGNPDPYYQFGYSLFGKLLYGFSCWVHDEAQKRGIKKLFFCARDGWMMKRAYDICFPGDEIDSVYLEVSRRSLRVPSLWKDKSNKDIIKKALTGKRTLLMSSVFDCIGLDMSQYRPQLERYGLSEDSVFATDKAIEDSRLLGLLDEIKTDFQENSKREYVLLERYLRQLSMSGPIGIVDTGCAGTMQRFIEETLNDLRIGYRAFGFYFGVSCQAERNIVPGVKLDLDGYLFNHKDDGDESNLLRPFGSLFEWFFFEMKGSVKNYQLDGDAVVAERMPFEFDKVPGKEEHIRRIQAVQEGSLDFLSVAKEDGCLPSLRLSMPDCFDGLSSFATDPSLTDVAMFGDIPYETMGAFRSIAAPDSLSNYVIHPRKLIADLVESGWKTGFLKRLFKIKLPYCELYNHIRKIR